jgi:assimilatory nitrate reductase catalytic subunit
MWERVCRNPHSPKIVVVDRARVGLVKKVSVAPGQALDDFSILKLIAHYWGCGQMFSEWESPEAVFRSSSA